MRNLENDGPVTFNFHTRLLLFFFVSQVKSRHFALLILMRKRPGSTTLIPLRGFKNPYFWDEVGFFGYYLPDRTSNAGSFPVFFQHLSGSSFISSVNSALFLISLGI